MREYVVYILKSVRYQKTYVGFTSNLIQRFNAHNKQATKGYTKRYRPWVVIYVTFFKTKSEALKKEKMLKSGKGREWIKQNLLSTDAYPPEADRSSSYA